MKGACSVRASARRPSISTGTLRDVADQPRRPSRRPSGRWSSPIRFVCSGEVEVLFIHPPSALCLVPYPPQGTGGAVAPANRLHPTCQLNQGFRAQGPVLFYEEGPHLHLRWPSLPHRRRYRLCIRHSRRRSSPWRRSPRGSTASAACCVDEGVALADHGFGGPTSPRKSPLMKAVSLATLVLNVTSTRRDVAVLQPGLGVAVVLACSRTPPRSPSWSPCPSGCRRIEVETQAGYQ